jgi:hypothetical protein
LTKRLQPILVVAMLLLVPSLVFAGANKFGVAKASHEGDRVVVSVSVSNAQRLAGLDIPLRYSEGVRLEEVTFEGSRVAYFDFKSAYIKQDERLVLIGLLPQLTPERKPDLAVGEGEICKFHFRVEDESVSKITIEAIEMKDPNHTLSYIYVDGGEIRTVKPEFSDITVALGNAGELPRVYALQNNYPNPFNPTTTFEYSLAQPGHCELAVFNILGQKVTTLVNGYRAAGTYEVKWDASSHSSGVYFYRLESGDFSECKKAVLVK